MGNSTSKANKITAHDKAILDLKVQRDKLKQYNKRLNLVINKELEIAKTHLTKGDKKRALLALRRKKFQEGLLEKTELQMTNLDELTFSIEQALVEQQVFAGLAAGNQVLKELHKEMSLSDVEKLMDETAEGIAYQNEIDEMLSTRLSVAEEEDIERELDMLLEDELPSPPVASKNEQIVESISVTQDVEEEIDQVLFLLAAFIMFLFVGRCTTPASKRLRLWLKAQSEADQLVEIMAAQVTCVIDGLRPCRRREKIRTGRAQRQRHIICQLQEDIDGDISAANRAEYDDELAMNEIWRQRQRQWLDRSDTQDPSSTPTGGHMGDCAVEGDNIGNGHSPDEQADERLWEFIAGWCLIGCICTGAALIISATLKAQNSLSPETPWTIDPEDGDSLIDIIVAHIMNLALGIKRFGDRLMESGIFVFVVGINGYVLVRQRVFVRRRHYEAELIQRDVLPGDPAKKEYCPDEEQQRISSLKESQSFGNAEGIDDFYANVEMIQSSGSMAVVHTTSEDSHLTGTRTRDTHNWTKDQQDEDNDSPNFRAMSFLAWFNYLQIGILVIEFMQLFSFPLRELMEFYNQTEKTGILHDNAKSVLTILGVPTTSSSADLAYLGRLGEILDTNPANMSKTIFIDNLKNNLNVSNATALAVPWIENITGSTEWVKNNLPAWLPDIAAIIANSSLSEDTQGNLEEMRAQLVKMGAEIASQEWLLAGTNIPSIDLQSAIQKLTLPPKKMSEDGDIVMQVVNNIGLQPSINTHDWYLLRFWSCFVAVLLGWLVALSIHGWNRRCRRLRREGSPHWPAISVGWSVLYLPILSTFLSSAACQSQAIQAYAHERFAQQQDQARRHGNSTYPSSGVLNSVIVSLLDPTSSANPSLSSLICTGPEIQPSVYLAISLLAYTLSYLLFMVFLTSFERVPAKSEICFRPNGVVVLKNLGLLLAVDFLLIQSPSQRRFRGLVSIAIMLVMACYTIRMKPCYWNKLNYWRAFSFSCVLYASLLVALLCPAPEFDNVRGNRIGGKWVMAPHLKMGYAWTVGGGLKVILAWIATGWIILIIVFVVGDRVFMRHWMQKKRLRPAATDAYGFHPDGGLRASLSYGQDRQCSQDERTMTAPGAENMSETSESSQYLNSRQTVEATAAEVAVTPIASGSHWSIVDLGESSNATGNRS
ncbi:Vacuolar protein sorting-associated protein 20 [Haplosporangium sp. Z 27]|nr:Vacuolar protein sorting-associated protein 20 [Haplosporangium sp. Z 27]